MSLGSGESGGRLEVSPVSRSLPLMCAAWSDPFMGDVGDPGRGGNGGGTPMPEVGLEPYPLDEDEVIVAPAVDGRGGSFACAELRLSRFIVRDSSGDDFLCAAGDSGGSVADPEASGGRGLDGMMGEPMGEDVSEMAASDPRLPRYGLIGDIGAGRVSWRVLFFLNHALGFLSGPRSLSFVGVALPLGNA